jgi:hypothetical protein
MAQVTATTSTDAGREKLAGSEARLSERIRLGRLPAVLLIPHQRDDQGRGIYLEQELDLVKALRDSGLTSETLDGPHDTVVSYQYSAELAAAAATILLTAAEIPTEMVSALVDGLRTWLGETFGSAPSDTAHLRLAELDITSDGQRYHLRDLAIDTTPEGLPDVVNALNRLGQRGNGDDGEGPRRP